MAVGGTEAAVLSRPGGEQGEIRPSRLPRPRLLLGLIVVVALLGGMAGLGTLTWFDHRSTVDDWSTRLRLSARLVEAQLRALHAVSAATLSMVADRLGARAAVAPHERAADNAWLGSVLEATPYGAALAVIDLRGETMRAADPQGIFAVNGRGHDYFTKALDAPGRPVMSAVVTAGVEPRRVTVISRTMSDGTGRLVGVAALAIKVEYFVDFFRELDPNSGSLFMASRLDGGLVARHPQPEATFTRFDTKTHPFTRFAQGPTGIYRSPSVIDGMERLIAYRILPDLNMVVTSGVPVEAVFRDWGTRTRRNVVLFVAAMALLLVLAVLTGESLRHETKLLHDGERRTRELTAALAEKDVLFQEVHHRVKNNLQVISSLLTMQSLHVTDEKVKETLKDALDRIHSMGLVHQTLYERNLASNVDLATYFGKLAEALAGSYSSAKGGVTVEVEVEGTLDLERAVPLGMLANEVLSNAMKHAFPDGRRGTIWITLVREAGEWHFTVRDNGVGMPDKPGRGIGIGLIKALTRQLGGRSHIIVDEGTVVSVTFPD